MAFEVRAATESEIPAVIDAMALGFHTPHADDETSLRATGEVERSRCAFDGGEMVGTLGAYSFDLTIPGGSASCGGTTWVTVRPTHRRRGILRAMMRAHLDDARERGEPLAALWASESGIYGRFGYGPAAVLNRFVVDTAHADFARDVPGGGTTRLLSGETAREVLPPVYDEARRRRPGHFARSAAWWEHRSTSDAPEFRQGMGPLRHVVYERGSEPRGYLQFRANNGWHDATGLPASSLFVVDLQALDAEAGAALWRFALDVDLISRVEAWNRPSDDPLPWLLADPRRLEWNRRDGLWLRLVDVGAALAARRYATEDTLTIEVRDSFCPWNEGTYHLDGGPDGAQCDRSDREAELRVDATDLGAVYFGANTWSTLAAVGRLDGTPEALRRADAMFGWPTAAWCPEIF